MWMDDLDPARSTFVDLEKRSREVGDEGTLAIVSFMLAQVETSAGRWADAVVAHSVARPRFRK